jgi:hypothetical protein
MPKGKGIYDDEDSDESKKGDPPGPSDQGGEGGMATRENAPDVADTTAEPTA